MESKRTTWAAFSNERVHDVAATYRCSNNVSYHLPQISRQLMTSGRSIFLEGDFSGCQTGDLSMISAMSRVSKMRFIASYPRISVPAIRQASEKEASVYA